MKSNQKTLRISILVNVLLFLILFLLFRPVFEKNDDMGLANMVSGVQGASDAHMVYVNYLIGLLLQGLYQLCQRVPWYTLLQYAVLFFAYTAVTYVVLQKKEGKVPEWMLAVVLFFFAYEGYIQLQYTKTAGIACAAGIFLMFFAVTEEKLQKKSFLLGLAIAWIASLYRFPQFLLVACLMTGIGVYQLLVLVDVPAQRRKSLAVRYFSAFATLFVLAAAAYGLDRLAYQSPEWKEFEEYNQARTELFDYGFPDFNENKEAYLELGLNRNAYRLIRDWNQLDTEKFTVDVMNRLIALKPAKKVDADFFRNFVRKVPLRFYKVPVFLCFVFLFFCWLAGSRHRKADLAAFLWEMLLIAAAYLYLFYEGRYLRNRVDVGMWMGPVLCILWTYGTPRIKVPRWSGVVLAAAVLVLAAPFWKGQLRINNRNVTQNMLQERAVLEEMQKDAEHLYLTKAGTISYAKSYGIFETPPFGLGRNIASLGGWPAKTPLYMKTLERFQITNPYRDMIGNENVFLLDDDIESTMKYLRKYYDENAEAELVRELGGKKIYRIY